MNMRKLIIYLGLPCLMFLSCFTWPFKDWFTVIFKQGPGMRLPYCASFFFILMVELVTMMRVLHAKSLFITVLVGAIAGQMNATVSICISILFINGVHKFVNAIHFFGVKNNIFVFYSAIAFLLGGWIFGAISLAIAKLLLRERNSKVEPNSQVQG